MRCLNHKYLILFVVFIFILGCSNSKKNKEYLFKEGRYYYKLISFESAGSKSDRPEFVWLRAAFQTQHDSVFWDSYNNLNDRFFIHRDSLDNSDFFQSEIKNADIGDSVCLLIKTADFFKQQFGTGIPFFALRDSIVKVNFKMIRSFTEQEFLAIENDLQRKELEQIKAVFANEQQFEQANDPLGFFWLEHKKNQQGSVVREGETVRIRYRGSFLNGRYLESSGSNFEFVYGTPDQVLRGLNFVIGKLKTGENAKIILPSRLAFGQHGSSNGTVPPYTPLIYQIEILPSSGL